MNRNEIESEYRERREEIEARLEQFNALRDASDERLFKELVFVILTSQSRAEKAWDAVEQLEEEDLLLDGSLDQIEEVLADHGIQYERSKAGYIVSNRKNLSQPTLEDPTASLKLSNRIKPDDLESTRAWLVENLAGVSWKGASHFLRNIGYGDEFAIVSGYIARTLFELGLRDSADPPTTEQEYLEAENSVQDLSEELGIGIQELDLLLWAMQTGEVFK